LWGACGGGAGKREDVGEVAECGEGADDLCFCCRGDEVVLMIYVL